MRLISRQLTIARKWPFLIIMVCLLSGCYFFHVGGLHKPTKYDGIWRATVISPDCINFESETQVLGGHFAVKTRDLPPSFRKKFGSIRGGIRDGGFLRAGKISTAARISRSTSRVATIPESEGAIVTPNDQVTVSFTPIAQLEMVFPNRRNGSGTFQSLECSGTITAQWVRRHF